VVEQRIRNIERSHSCVFERPIKSGHLTILSGAFFVFSLQFVAVAIGEAGTTYAIRTGVNPASDLEIIRYYRSEILKKDGSIIFDGREDSGRRDISGKFVNKDKKQIWVEAEAWNGGDDYRLNVIETK
jgi:hypothetical protein